MYPMAPSSLFRMVGRSSRAPFRFSSAIRSSAPSHCKCDSGLRLRWRSGVRPHKDPLRGLTPETNRRGGLEAEAQVDGCDLGFVQVLVKRGEALTVDFALDREVIEDVGEREQQFGAIVREHPLGRQVERG